jgi:hypothetical protein
MNNPFMNNYLQNEYMKNLHKQKSVKRDDNRHEVVKIPGLHSYFNSVSIITGPQGSGKDTALFSEIIPQSHLPQTHLIIYVKKKSYDPTVEAAKPLLGCPFVECGYDECEKIIQNNNDLKQKYYKLLRQAKQHNVNPNSIPQHVADPEEAEQLLEDLYLSDWSQPWLNTILAFSDCGNSKLWKNKDGYFMNLFKLCRDANATAYLLIHGFNQLPAPIKENCAVVWLSKMGSNERLAIVHRDSNNGVDYKEFKNKYAELKNSPYRFLVIDCIGGNISFK